ncbi:MAG: hypothetical protein P4M11_04180 [Candidatus Pacebacteria bacterium]|nr:hypothetical protein [Candidatus Paceibacterota bacterium]
MEQRPGEELDIDTIVHELLAEFIDPLPRRYTVEQYRVARQALRNRCIAAFQALIQRGVVEQRVDVGYDSTTYHYRQI